MQRSKIRTKGVCSLAAPSHPRDPDTKSKLSRVDLNVQSLKNRNPVYLTGTGRQMTAGRKPLAMGTGTGAGAKAGSG